MSMGIGLTSVTGRCDRCRCDMDGHIDAVLLGHFLCALCERDLERRALLCHIAKTDALNIDATTKRGWGYSGPCASCGAMPDEALHVELWSRKQCYIQMLVCEGCFYERDPYGTSMIDALRRHMPTTLTDIVTTCFGNILPQPARDTIVDMMMAAFEQEAAEQRAALHC